MGRPTGRATRRTITVARKKKGDPVNGWLVIDKPEGMTSTQVVGKARWLFNAQKAGHGGTLDPFATGVLPIAFGEATKTVQYAMDGEKRYRFTIRWGQATTTDDCEGEVIAENDARPTPAAITAAVPAFIGRIEQIPPQFSAIKIAGERAYDIARDGERVDLTPRPVEVYDFVLTDQPDDDHAVFEVTCGKGTYMRALARDLGERLGCHGHLATLRRLTVGPFTLDDAVTLDHISGLTEGSDRSDLLLPVETPLDDIPAVALSDDQAQRLRQGQTVALLKRSDRAHIARLHADGDDGATVLAMADDRPVAIARLDGPDLKPVRVLNL